MVYGKLPLTTLLLTQNKNSIMTAETKLIMGTLLGIVSFYMVLGGFTRLSEVKKEN